MIISGAGYICFIPISFTHYIKLNNKFDMVKSENDNHEDIL